MIDRTIQLLHNSLVPRAPANKTEFQNTKSSNQPSMAETQRNQPTVMFDVDEMQKISMEGALARIRSISVGAKKAKQPTIKDTIVDNARKLFVEFSGDVIFIYVGILQALSQGGVSAAAFAHGITIAVLIMGVGHISGGHFNPAVTLGVWMSGNMALVLAPLYIAAQLLGGFVGALLARASIPDEWYKTIGGGATVPAAGINAGQGIVTETILTYLLVMTVLVAAVDTDSNVLAALAIGLAITVDIFAGGSISGASMNPARSFGPSVVASIFGVDGAWHMHYIYYVGPILGAALAGATYKLILAKEGERWFW